MLCIRITLQAKLSVLFAFYVRAIMTRCTGTSSCKGRLTGTTVPCTRNMFIPYMKMLFWGAARSFLQDLLCCPCRQSGLYRAKRCQAGSAAPRASGVWKCYCVVPDRWSGRWPCGEGMGERRIMAFSLSVLPWEWYRHRYTGMSMNDCETKMWSMIT